MTKREMLKNIKAVKSKYEEEGLTIIGLFGSYAKDESDEYSDIDIAYKIDYEKFSQYYQDGFSKLLRIEEIKEELQKNLHKKVDFIPVNNRGILEGIVNV